MTGYAQIQGIDYDEKHLHQLQKWQCLEIYQHGKEVLRDFLIVYANKENTLYPRA